MMTQPAERAASGMGGGEEPSHAGETGTPPRPAELEHGWVPFGIRPSRRSTTALCILLSIIAALVFGSAGFLGHLDNDDALYLYSAQQLVQGVPPFVSAFQAKGPFTIFLMTVAVSVGDRLGVDSVMAARIGFFLLSCAAVPLLYLLGSYTFKRHTVGLLSALAFLGYKFYGTRAGSGPRPKTPIVPLEILSLLLTSQRRWFWAGLVGALAALTWQPMAVYPACTIVLAFVQSPRSSRWPSTFRAIMGAALPVVITTAYFALAGAIEPFVQALVLVHLAVSSQVSLRAAAAAQQIIRKVQTGYATMAIPISLGLAAIVLLYAARLWANRGIRALVQRDPLMPVLLTFPLPFLWSLFDFQGPADFFVFLPYAALGFGCLLAVAIAKARNAGAWLERLALLVTGLALTAAATNTYGATVSSALLSQRTLARQVDALSDSATTTLSITRFEPLTLLRRANMTPYAFAGARAAYVVENTYPGGLEGWRSDLQAREPTLIILGALRAGFRPIVTEWFESGYYKLDTGDWQLLFPPRSRPNSRYVVGGAELPLLNPGFEETDPEGEPLGWTLMEWGMLRNAVRVESSAGWSAEGERSAQLTILQQSEMVELWSEPVSAAGVGTLSVSIMAYTESEDMPIETSILFFDAQGNQLGAEVSRDSFSWGAGVMQEDAVANAPQWAKSARMTISLPRAEAVGESLLLDDARVVATGSTWSTRFHRPDPWTLAVPRMPPYRDGPLAAAIGLLEAPRSESGTALAIRRLALSMASRLRKQDQGVPEDAGRGVTALAEGIRAHLAEAGSNSSEVALISQPSLATVRDHLALGHQIVALIGLWERVGRSHRFHRVGGHYVAVAAVDAQAGTVAYVDPYELDAFRSIPHERQAVESPLECGGFALAPLAERWRLGPDNWPFEGMNAPPDSWPQNETTLAAGIAVSGIPKAVLQIEAVIAFPPPWTN